MKDFKMKRSLGQKKRSQQLSHKIINVTNVKRIYQNGNGYL